MLKVYSYDIVCQEIPDEISLALNISGCPNFCPGCHSPWLASDEGEPMTEELLESLLNRYGAAITCVCFMGGDAEPGLISERAIWIKEKYPHLKTGWYSGRQEPPADFDINSLDYIKLGPYIAERGALKSPTTNQALYKILSDGSFIKCSF